MGDVDAIQEKEISGFLVRSYSAYHDGQRLAPCWMAKGGSILSAFGHARNQFAGISSLRRLLRRISDGRTVEVLHLRKAFRSGGNDKERTEAEGETKKKINI